MAEKVLVEFVFPLGSMWAGSGRLIERPSCRRRDAEPEIVVQREGYEPGTWADHPSENASETAALVYAATRYAIAEEVRAAGCMCFKLMAFVEAGEDFDGEIEEQWDPDDECETVHVVKAHDSRCPVALVAKILAREEG